MRRLVPLLALVAPWTLLGACSGSAFSGTPSELRDGGGAASGAGGGESSGDGGQATAAGGRAGGNGNGGSSGNKGSGGKVSGGGAGTGGQPSAGGAPGSGGSGALDGSVAGDCVNPSQCPSSSSVCEIPACVGKRCAFAAATTPPAQVVGDCLESQCVPDGITAVLVIKANDTDSTDGNECTKDACDQNGATHTPQVGVSCNGGRGHCDANGACAECTVNADCGLSTECSKRVCTQAQCKSVQTAKGTLCNFPMGAVQADQCDGLGACVDCVNNGGCDESSICTSAQKCIYAG